MKRKGSTNLEREQVPDVVDRVPAPGRSVAFVTPRRRAFPPALTGWEVTPLLALCLIVFLLWCWTRDRLSPANWGVPVSYSGDSQQILGWIKAAAEGDYVPFCASFVKRLGAPYTANWNDYPMYEKPITFLLGLCARWFGLFQAANAGMVLVHLTAAVSFYLCCRFLKYARVWSFVGALLFAFTYFHTSRGLGHLLLAFSYTLPFALLSTWLILSSRRMRLWDRSCWLCLVTAVVMGFGNPYNLWMYAQLVCLSLLANAVARRRTQNLTVGVLSLGAAGAAFLAINAPTFVYQWEHGRNPATLVRFYLECELMALKPMELVIPPPTHHVPFLAAIGDAYKDTAYVRGEMFSPYIGVIGASALLWMAGEALLLVLRPGRRRIPAHPLQCLWVLIYATLGGLNCLVGLAGMQLFRSSNRYSIFIALLALLFLVARLSRSTRPWGWPLRYGLAAFVVVIGLYDQLPRRTPHGETVETARLVENDRAFTRALEAQLPAGAMVFQFPVMNFPDANVDRHVDSYEHLRPFFFSKALRFSFGSDSGRPREAWQLPLNDVLVTNAIKELEGLGFSAIYVNLKAFTNYNGTLGPALAAAGRNWQMQDDLHGQLCVLLQPAARPELPHTEDSPLISYGSGFFQRFQRVFSPEKPAEDRHWTTGDGSLSFFISDSRPANYTIKCALRSFEPRMVKITLNGSPLWAGPVGTEQAVPLEFTVTARPRYNVIRLTTDAKPAPLNEEGWPPVSVGVVNLMITRAGGGN